MNDNFILPPHAIVGLPVNGSAALFPVRRIYCVGRNYAAHAREMGFDPEREPPFFFCKPNDAESVVPVPAGVNVALPYPPRTENYHYEIELVVAIGKAGRDIAPEDAAAHIFGYAVGLDMTRRDVLDRIGRFLEEERRLARGIRPHLARVGGVVASYAVDAADGEQVARTRDRDVRGRNAHDGLRRRLGGSVGGIACDGARRCGEAGLEKLAAIAAH